MAHIALFGNRIRAAIKGEDYPLFGNRIRALISELKTRRERRRYKAVPTTAATRQRGAEVAGRAARAK